MTPLPWFRFYSEALSDRKIAWICRKTKQPKATILGVWTILLSLASESPDRGKLLIANDIWLTEQEIQEETGLNKDAFDAIIDSFCHLGMVERNEGITVINWDKRQFKSDSSTERVRRHRGRKAEEETVDGNGTETLQERSGNAPDTDTDQDTESEEETESPSDLPAPPQDFAGWENLIRDSKNRPATLRFMFEVLYPGRDPPDYGYLGKIAKKVSGAGRLAELLWQHSTKPPKGDILAYILQSENGRKKRNRNSTTKPFGGVEALEETGFYDGDP